MSLNESLQPIPAGAQEIKLQLPHLEIYALTWGDPQGKPLLALHGWLDNAMTFVKLAPSLAEAGYYVVAPDLAGQGFSGWRSAGQTYLLVDYCLDIQALSLVLGWSKFTLLGHSMGAGIASLLAGAAPHLVDKLILLDGIGTLTTEAKDAAAQLGQALERWAGHQAKQLQQADKDRVSAFSGKLYPSIEAAATARMQGVGAVDFAAALALCQRALRPQSNLGWLWRSDPRLRHPSALRFTQEQNLSFMRSIQAPTLYLEADQGLLINRPDLATRVQAIKNLQKLELPGGHHLHLEERSYARVAQAVTAFISCN